MEDPAGKLVARGRFMRTDAFLGLIVGERLSTR